jgi:hypothetical protein
VSAYSRSWINSRSVSVTAFDDRITLLQLIQLLEIYSVPHFCRGIYYKLTNSFWRCVTVVFNLRPINAWLLLGSAHAWLDISARVGTRLNIYLFIYLALPTRAGSPQQHMPITVGPFCLTHPANFPCGRKPEYPEETHDFRQSVDFYSFRMGTGFESHWESSHWDLNLRSQRWKASALTTWPPKPLKHISSVLLF